MFEFIVVFMVFGYLMLRKFRGESVLATTVAMIALFLAMLFVAMS